MGDERTRLTVISILAVTLFAVNTIRDQLDTQSILQGSLGSVSDIFVSFIVAVFITYVLLVGWSQMRELSVPQSLLDFFYDAAVYFTSFALLLAVSLYVYVSWFLFLGSIGFVLLILVEAVIFFVFNHRFWTRRYASEISSFTEKAADYAIRLFRSNK